MKWFKNFFDGSIKSRFVGFIIIAAAIAGLLFVLKPFSPGPLTGGTGAHGETPTGGPGGPAGGAGRPSPGNRPQTSDNLPKSRTTVLLIGVDGDSFYGVRSDSLILATFQPTENRIDMMSIPRDSYVWLDGVGYWDKINHAYALAPRGKNAEAAMAAVSELLAVPVTNYAVINMAGFEQLVDIMGGIDVYIERDLSPQLRQGHQRLDGEAALAYARFRRDIEGDFGRSRRQQQLLTALLAEALKVDNLGKLGKLASEIRSHIKTNLSFSDILRLGLAGRRLKSDSIEGSTLTGTNRTMGGIYYLEVDLIEARTAAYRQVFGQEPDDRFIADAGEYADLVREVVQTETARLARLAAENSPDGDPSGEPSDPDERDEAGEGGDAGSDDGTGGDAGDSGGSGGDDDGDHGGQDGSDEGDESGSGDDGDSEVGGNAGDGGGAEGGAGDGGGAGGDAGDGSKNKYPGSDAP